MVRHRPDAGNGVDGGAAESVMFRSYSGVNGIR